MCMAEAGAHGYMLCSHELANTAVYFQRYLHLEEYRLPALSSVTLPEKRKDANTG